MNKYKVSLYGGSHQAIVEAETKKAAELQARWEFGNNNVDYVRRATQDDLMWTQAMGGDIGERKAG